MQTPDQLEKKIQKYWKLDLSDKETLEKLSRADDLCELKLELLRKVSSFISIARKMVLRDGCRRGFERRFLYKELIETLDPIAAESKIQRLRDIIYKARIGQNLSIVEYNWLQKELKKF